MTKRHGLVLFLFVVSLFLLVACGGGDPTATPVQPTESAIQPTQKPTESAVQLVTEVPVTETPVAVNTEVPATEELIDFSGCTLYGDTEAKIEGSGYSVVTFGGHVHTLITEAGQKHVIYPAGKFVKHYTVLKEAVIRRISSTNCSLEQLAAYAVSLEDLPIENNESAATLESPTAVSNADVKESQAVCPIPPGEIWVKLLDAQPAGEDITIELHFNRQEGGIQGDLSSEGCGVIFFAASCGMNEISPLNFKAFSFWGDHAPLDKVAEVANTYSFHQGCFQPTASP